MPPEEKHQLTEVLLRLFAQSTNSTDYLDSAAQVIRDWCSCDALGIRVIDQAGTIGYEAHAGFDSHFLELEDKLSIQTDSCVCTRTIQQKFVESDRSFLTSYGSFCCGDIQCLVQPMAACGTANYRGACAKFGFVSLAVIPIRCREVVVGAIQLADRRPGFIAPKLIAFIEDVSPLIGEAMQRFHTEVELSRYRSHLEEVVKRRTGELEKANARLQNEVAERLCVEAELRKMAEELRRSNQDLEQFAYVASHDLQEPLRAVSGYVQLLQRRYADKLDPKGEQFIAEAVEGAGRMHRLIDDLLAFSRVGSRGRAFESADLNDALAKALFNLKASIAESGAVITHDTLPVIKVDAAQVGQLFQNLIGNAIKFHSDQPPRIHVGAQSRNSSWVFSVKDNGIGIEPQYFDRVFKIFQRLHTRKSYSGTGIGLAICKKIVERHGGTIWIESQPSEGATFYFTLADGVVP